MMENQQQQQNGVCLQTLKQKSFAFKSLTPCNLNNCSRREVRDYFENTYDLDEAIFTGLKDELYMEKCPDRLRLPLIFYFGHTATLYVNKMLLAGLIKERIDRELETMFETGVDEMSWDDTENYRMGGAYKWPSFSSVMDYRQKVREMVINVIETAPLSHPITQEHPWWSIFMGMEHERIHIETSSVLIRQLPREFLQRPIGWEHAPATANIPAGENKFVQLPEGEAVFGKPRDFPTYGWDNEYGLAKMNVPAFEATQYLITNKEFMEFVRSRGYEKRELWSDEGWKWVQFRQARHPTFWVCHRQCKSGCGADLASYSHCTLPAPGTDESEENCTYKYRAMYDLVDMPLDWPVDVNYHEAKAYCTWKGPAYRLLTEAEHHRIRGEQAPTSDFECDYICKAREELPPYNINLQYGSSNPVNLFPANSLGFHDVYGNVWEWVEDHFNGLPGFTTSFLYDDFSSPCFDGRHTMMQGGSWISTGDEASRFARFSFRRHFFQHLGFRLARSLTDSPTPVRLCRADVYDESADSIPAVTGADPSQCLVASTNIQFQYDQKSTTDKLLLTEYGESVEYGVPLINHCQMWINKTGGPPSSCAGTDSSAAIVFGCGPGFTSFLLTKIFTDVLGVDYGGRFISIAKELQRTGAYMIDDGKSFTLPFNDDDVKIENVTFKQLTWTPNEIEGFNFILFENLDRLMEPKGWLLKLWECLVPNSLLVISASNKWNSANLKEYISEWFDLLDETAINGKCVTTWQLVAAKAAD